MSLGVSKEVSIHRRQLYPELSRRLSLGVPMILMGDEARRSQHGNDNAYCQDNETSWFDWTLVTKHAELHRFVKLLFARRLLRDVEHENERVSLNQLIRKAGKGWHGVKLGQPDWSDHSHSIAFTAEIRRMGLIFHVIANSYWESLDFELPKLRDISGDRWRRWIDTSLDTPSDIVEWQAAPSISRLFLSVRAPFCDRVFREYRARQADQPKEGKASRLPLLPHLGRSAHAKISCNHTLPATTVFPQTPLATRRA